MAKTLKPPAISQEQVDEICTRVSNGETCKGVCRDLGVSPATFRLMVADDRPTGLAARYARVRESQAEAWQDEIVALADETANDTVDGRDGQPQQNTEWITRSRLRVDTRKWLMAKLHPRAYGEKIEVNGKQTLEAGDSMVSFLSSLRDGKK